MTALSQAQARDWPALQSFELAHGPPNEMFVDAPCEEVQLGAVEGPVIVDPAPDLRIDLLSERWTGPTRSAE